MANDFVVSPQAQVRYLQRRLAELELLVAGLQRGEFEQAQTLGHQIKGNAQSFEFKSLEGLGIRLEQSAKNRDVDGSIKIIGSLKQEVLHLLGTVKNSV